ncbi:unnamed protein product [Schistosoma margrebowiei]|uniref:Uncharacterized protein n=1 Tax=Schistosoma margrebowiei TaxID=48269 RepID=A0A183LFZ4_9TREM|nr:unnamed protein product [Schistosoma margrebowiei]
MNNSIEFNLNFIPFINNYTCLLSIKTFYDLPSTYQMNSNIDLLIKSFYDNNNNHYYYYYDLLQWNIIIPIIIVILTIIGNSLSCFIALNDRHLRHKSNIFFISLSITNIIYSSIIMLFNIIYNLIHPFYFNDLIIKLFFSLDKLFCTVTILHLVVMAFDRFIYIKSPLNYSHCIKLKYLLMILISLWFLAFLITIIPIQLNWNHIYDKQSIIINNNNNNNNNDVINDTYDTKQNCTTIQSSIEKISFKQINLLSINKIQKNFFCIHKVNLFYTIMNTIFSFIIPLLIMIILYTYLYLLTKQHINRLNIFSNFKKNHLNFNHHNNNQFIDLLQNSSNFFKKCKTFLNLNSIDFNHHHHHIINKSITLSMNSIKIPIQLNNNNNKQFNKSLYDMNIINKNDYIINTINKSIQLTNHHSYITIDQSMNTRRKHSLPLYNISRNSSWNTYNDNNNNGNNITRPQIIINYPEKQIYNAHKAAITLGVILGSFTICWLPYFTINCLASFCDCIPSKYSLILVIIIFIIVIVTMNYIIDFDS